MFRSILQIYVKDRKEAIELYKKAFDAKLGFQDIAEDGTIIHMELDICGQAIAVGEVPNASCDDIKSCTGNTMQFCLQFGEGQEDRVKKAYDTLIDGGKTLTPLGDVGFSSCGVEFIDKYGVWWCLFI